MRVEESVEVERPIGEVFTYAANPENLPEWSGLVVEVKNIRRSSEGIGVGDTFTSVAKFLGRRFETPLEVTAYEPNRRYSVHSTGGPLEQQWTRTCEESGEGRTRLTQVVEGEPGTFFKLTGPLLEKAGRRQFKTDLQTLKDILESRGDDGSA